MLSVCSYHVTYTSVAIEVNNRNTTKRREICSKLTIKSLKRCLFDCSGVFTVNFEHI